jgi:hypothetical protein
MKKAETLEKQEKIGYGAFAFIAVLFTLVIVLFLGALLVMQ